METSEMRNMTAQALWGTAKQFQEEIAIQAYLKNQEKYQIQNLTSHLKEQEAEQQINPKPSQRREIIKIREEINNIESKNKQTNKQTKQNRTVQ